MSSDDLLKLIRQQQGKNRAEFAKKQKEGYESDLGKNEFRGTYMGPNAEEGCDYVVLENGNAVPCEKVTSGGFNQGQTVLVTMQAGSNRGVIDGMPS